MGVSAVESALAQAAYNDAGIPIPENSQWSSELKTWVDRDTGAPAKGAAEEYVVLGATGMSWGPIIAGVAGVGLLYWLTRKK